ncbi:hypothetical protein HMPREF0765_1475 [Sphingobacterium spiritivorum ATCC 33300]|uniref:Uncharacterized protein n=1 Tax=Sphingobacterium spiritivorum ATCC 33300 TaxID=525372 RepID=C2FVW9_SPHSI|nr:hypothetical protein HMPREF0765_1475 [Sphingobacterium spiritivorum ATCC 33300]
MRDSFKGLLPLIIPEGVADYFEMTHYSKDSGSSGILLLKKSIVQ